MVKKTVVEANEFGAFRVAKPCGEGAVPVAGRADAKGSNVDRRLAEAGRILRRLPYPKELAALARTGGAWPGMKPAHVDMVDAQFELDKQGARAVTKPAGLSGDEIDRFDEVMGWLLKLPVDDRTIAFMRMLGFGRRKMAQLRPDLGSPDTIGRVWGRVRAALEQISK